MEMSQSVWSVRDDRIFFRAGEASMMLSAIEVFQIVFGRVTEVRGHRFDEHPVKSLPLLSFSRYPASPAIRISASGTHIHAEIGVVTANGFAALSTDADQIIAANRWYPVKAGTAGIVVEWLKSLGLKAGDTLTIGALIAIRSAVKGAVEVIDEVALTSDYVASGAEHSGKPIAGLAGALYPYQSGGVAFLQLVAEQGVGCILGDEMGLGKTLQIIALIQSEKNAGRQPALVVAPATLLENWRRELALFAPSLLVHVHMGALRPGISRRLLAFDVTVVSYETAVRDEPLLASIDWNLVALDEAQNIKNPAAQRTLTVKRIPRRVSVAVTGTPVENSLDDLWSLADFALPGLLGELGSFRAEFGGVEADAARLAPVVSPILLRRKVLDVASDLPQKIEIPQPLRVTRVLAEGYEALRKATLDEFGAAGGLVATSRLRQYCAHPALLDENSGDPAVDMPKYQRLIEILEEVFLSCEKALIFCSYQGMIDMFMKDLPVRFASGFFRFIDGRVAVADRQPTVDEFFCFVGSGALFLNPRAAGTGLNITAANHVIHYNPEWNPALTDQASGRAYRRKQERPVTVHHLYFTDTVEEVIMDRAGFKRQLAAKAVTGHSGESDPEQIARALQISPYRNAEVTE
jgi:SNF2 family DNA or RNA helicase